MNEGIGKVLRFGAYSEEVVNRLKWMRDVLGPALGAAIRQMPDGLPVNAILAKAIAMGDEFHQRNIAASLVFLKEVAPQIVRLPLPEQDCGEVIRFLADTDQFFLNVMMATGKAVMDAARTVQEGTVVTAMCRNGHSFGIRISGMGTRGSPARSTRRTACILQATTVTTPARIWATARSRRPSASAAWR